MGARAARAALEEAGLGNVAPHHNLGLGACVVTLCRAAGR